MPINETSDVRFATGIKKSITNARWISRRLWPRKHSIIVSNLRREAEEKNKGISLSISPRVAQKDAFEFGEIAQISLGRLVFASL